MATIAVGRIPRMFALAKGDLLLRFNRKLHWRKVSPLVSTIAKGLIVRLTTGTVSVVTGFQFHHFRLLIGNHGFTHTVSSQSKAESQQLHYDCDHKKRQYRH